MKFVIMGRANAESEAGAFPERELLEAMLEFDDALADAGVLVAAEGLHPSSEGARISYSDGKPTVIDGPFETREVIAAFWIIDATSQEEAIRWALRIPYLADGEAIEVRQVYDATEFPEEMLSPGVEPRERLVRGQAAKASLS